MLLPDNIYRRIPQYWILAGVLFLFFGLIAGRTYSLFPVYMGFGALSIARGIWIYQARWKHHHKNEMKMLRSTQIIDHSNIKLPDK